LRAVDLRPAVFLLPVVFFAAKASTSVLHRMGCNRQPISPCARLLTRTSTQPTTLQLTTLPRMRTAQTRTQYAITPHSERMCKYFLHSIVEISVRMV
jgi:hypothetical protein